MDLFQVLDLDSEIFGFPVAKILPDKLAQRELVQLLSGLRQEKVRLVFWASNPDDKESQRAARRCHGFLADRKVTFVADIGQSPARPVGSDWDIGAYTDASSCADLESLAVQVGRQSRFGADPRIPDDKLVAMYTVWIRNSVNGQIADSVLVAHRSGRIVGMVTLGVKNGRGDIGLFAVDSAMRRKNLGVSLVHAAQEWVRRRGLTCSQVVTQETNVAACRLYEKCDYRIEKVECFYHFWI